MKCHSAIDSPQDTTDQLWPNLTIEALHLFSAISLEGDHPVEEPVHPVCISEFGASSSNYHRMACTFYSYYVHRLNDVFVSGR